MPRNFILSINAGSSSLKITLFKPSLDDPTIPVRIASANVTGLTAPPAQLKYTRAGSKPENGEAHVSSHDEAFEHILELFEKDEELKDFSSKDEVEYTCHRVVHGGDFGKDVLITPDTLHRLEAVEELAPLHNGAAIAIIKTCVAQLPHVKNVGCFDSAFHATLPLATRTYAIDQDIATKKGLRKYGFHGTSYSYILRVTSKYLNKSPDQTSLIALHLGSGASMCAIKNGKSVDTTMGLTPVSGLPGGTRSGDIDPSLIFHYTSDVASLSRESTRELHITTAEDILNKQSGWKALAGTTNFAEIAKPDASAGAKLALDIFVDRILGYFGSYFVKVGGKVDAVVFAGGIGEKSDLLRKRVIDAVGFLGLAVDEDKNKKPADETVADISGNSSGPKTLVVQTDEEVRQILSTKCPS
ncbi:putative acetate kinase [Phaeomoniella chlamydospora]|uniref:Probable acetate kinase n=1 Tax=Phaeomoniella chlamydospora TaxID=158046 RepID=A0A0G2GIQ0_PHACM|nr:putative acetate kinase [Phaeomoniella chlamydospora]